MRKAGLALLILAILVPVLAFGLSNLFLLSPKGRQFLAGKVENRLLLETSTQGATWSPWNGITVYGIRVEQPEVLREAIGRPLLSVQSVRIHPDWSALLKKRLTPKGMEIVKPELHLPIELLSQIPQAKEEPALAAVTPAPAVLPPTAAPSPAEAASNPAPPQAVAQAESGVSEKNPTAPEVTVPNVWIHIRDGRLGIVSVMTPAPLFEAAGIDGSIPVSGKPAGSKISVSRLRGMAGEASGNIEIPLVWSAPVLGTKAVDGEMFGIDFKLGGHVALIPGIPFRIDASAPEQGETIIGIGGESVAKLGKVVSQGRAEGYLQIPATWQGKWIAQASDLDVEISGRRNRFDHGRAVVVFQKGALRCVDARLSSDEATIIGNGAVLTDGRMAANARIIASPETLASISSTIQPAGEAHLTPLSTPQRAALDLQIFGRPGNLHYKPDPMAAPIPLQ